MIVVIFEKWFRNAGNIDDKDCKEGWRSYPSPTIFNVSVTHILPSPRSLRHDTVSLL